MTQKRKAYAPFSLTSEAGVGQTPVEGYIDVNQMIYPSVDTGVIDENGQWQGVRASDNEFIAFTKDEVVPNTGEILTPSANPDGSWPLDMTGYESLFIAIKPARGGNYAIEAVMGPDAVKYANLSPVNAATTLRGSIPTQSASGGGVTNELFNDPAESLTADVWNILYIQEVLENQKLLQFKITNNSGGETASIECAFLRVI
jgi:hypothetical protein